jgi:hypothetical protein
MSANSMLGAMVQSTAADGLTFREILSDLPTDPASIFTIGFLLGSVALVVCFGGPRAGKGGPRR